MDCVLKCIGVELTVVLLRVAASRDLGLLSALIEPMVAEGAAQCVRTCARVRGAKSSPRTSRTLTLPESCEPSMTQGKQASESGIDDDGNQQDDETDAIQSGTDSTTSGASCDSQ